MNGANSKADAVQSLNRIRVAERTDADGSRHVWHQGDGVDLISNVDPEGKLLRQEFTFFEDYFLWVVNEGLRTGTVGRQRGSSAAASSEQIKLDAEARKDRLAAAAEAMGSYSGVDKYVLHIRHVIEQLLRGMEERSPVVITLTHGMPAVQQPRPRTAARRPTGWLVLAGLLLATAAAVAAAILHFR